MASQKLFNRIALLSITALAFVLLTFPHRTVEACGGFFCNQNQPVNQAAERIIFSINDDGTTTAVVQILYAGPAEQFSWLLPVPSVPTVSVSSNIAFQRLQFATNPTYTLTTEVEGECDPEEFLDAATAENGGYDDGYPEEPGSVTVEASGSVGPYDYTVISVSEDSEDLAEEALRWIEDNGYDSGEMGPGLIRPYLEEGMYLIAFKLTKGADSGEIRPVVLTYETDHPGIPIKLTAVAADDDMGVMVWVLGDDRSVPINYRHLVLNEALINWFNPSSNYNQVIMAAANEAGGQGFVTEMAGSTELVEDVVFFEWEEGIVEYLAGSDWTDRLYDLVLETFMNFSGWDGLDTVVREAVPLQDDISVEDFINCVFCYDNAIDEDAFDIETFITSLQLNVIDPVVETQELLVSQPYITRMYTTLSPDEMTKDPCFDINPGMEDFSNIHTATRIVECEPGYTMSSAPWRVELPQGDTVRGEGNNNWPFDVDSGQPINREIQSFPAPGEGVLETDNSVAISDVISRANLGNFGDLSTDSDGCSCSATSVNHLSMVWMLTAAVGVMMFRRKRRAEN